MNNPVVDVGNAQIVPRTDYVEVLEKIRAGGKCPFCEDQLEKHHPHPILWKSVHWIVTTNAWPYQGSRLHFLLISRTHVERVEDLTVLARVAFFDEFERLVAEYGLSGATILWRSGDTNLTGASVRHLHAQIVVGHPRTEDAEAITGLLGFRPS